jgi:hypothetical protein
MRILLERRTELIEQLRERMPEWPGLAELVARRLAAYQARAESIARRNRERAERIADGIRWAAGDAADRGSPGIVELVATRIQRSGPAAFGLEALPDDRVIKAALKGAIRPELACIPAVNGAAYGSTTATT